MEDKWILWNKQKPSNPGYYLFATRSLYENSYGAHCELKVDYYDPKLPKYCIAGKEFYESDINFFEIRAWMVLPEWPYHLKTDYPSGEYGK